LNDEQLDAVRGIREAARVQLTLMNDILEFAQLESGRVQVHATTVPVAEIVQRATALVRHQMREAGLTLRTEECDANTHAVADADRLQQILLNLLTNAVKFTSRGGEITVTCEAAGERVRIHVRDTGIGIAANQLQRIFSPFVQVEPSLAGPAGARGVGLGLAISRDLARAMSGDVTAQSTPGEGSTFTIDLPAGAPVPA
ncbi:MAG TPA: ATP-binding protein, partial [Thermoanaerobaculia bacterium]